MGAGRRWRRRGNGSALRRSKVRTEQVRRASGLSLGGAGVLVLRCFEGDVGAIKFFGVMLQFLEAFRADTVRGVDMKVLGEVIFEAHPAIVVADLATPGADP